MTAEEIKRLFFQTSTEKQYILSFPEMNFNINTDDLYGQEFTLEEKICSEQHLAFGSCEASILKFKRQYSNDYLIGKTVNVSVFIDGMDEPYQIGTYRIESDVPTNNRIYRDVVAYDQMYSILNLQAADWYNGLEFPLSMKEFRDSFSKFAGVSQSETMLVNDGMQVEKTINPDEISGKDILTAICEINGCFGHIGRSGLLEYITLKKTDGALYPANTLYPEDSLYPKDASSTRIQRAVYTECYYEDYKTQKISKVVIRKEESDIGASAGEGNCYSIEDNFLVYGKDSATLENIAQNILEVIQEISYRPYSAKCVGNPAILVGESIRIPCEYEIVESYVLNRVLTGVQGLFDSISADGERTINQADNSLRKSIIQLKGKTNLLSRTIEETKMTISDLEKNMQAQITVNANGLKTKVSKDSIVSEINQSAEKITIQADKIDLNGIVEADVFVTKFATIENLSTQKARIDSIAANYISAGQVAANYATIGSLNAVNASVSGKLEASQFTAENISAMNISVKSANVSGGFSASKITSGTISADRLDIGSIISSGVFKGAAIQCQAVNTGSVAATGGVSTPKLSFDGTSISKKTVTINGTTIHYLGY